jgi:membrane fusion protein, multidrug efflux system
VRALVVTLLLAACSSEPAAPQGRPAMKFPVEVTPVEARRVEYTLDAVGSVEAYERVQVTARIAGVVDRVRFSEGEVVKESQTLVEIEPRRYAVAVAAARAALEKADAERADAEAGFERRRQATEQNPGLIPTEEMESWRTRVRVAAANGAQAKAALDQAELNLRDAYVRAPMPGTIETRTVQTGQYVNPGTVLATLVRRDPLLVRFQVPEADAARVRPGMQAIFRVPQDSRDYTAAITHVAESADASSRMVSIVAEVSSEQRSALRPGAFAQVRVPIGESANAPVVPQTAIRPSERGFLAYVVEGDVARERVVQLGLRTSDGLVEIRSGLSAGEQLVVRGVEPLREGAPVRVQAAAGGPPAKPPPPKADVQEQVRP